MTRFLGGEYPEIYSYSLVLDSLVLGLVSQITHSVYTPLLLLLLLLLLLIL